MFPIIEVKNLTVSYNERVILDDVSFDIFPGEIFVIVGGSGCGKSTLLRQLIGIEQPFSGSIIIDGKDLTTANPKERTEIMKKYGVLFQSSGLIASMSIAENIALVLETIKDLDDETIYDIIKIKLNSVGLDGFQDFLPAEISGGMKKRAALARAMTLDPSILCFDEPSSGLDPTTSAALDNLIKEINRSFKTTMIVVTHDLASILNISDRIIMLDKSVRGIIATGTPEELKNNRSNQIVYNFFNRIG